MGNSSLDRKMKELNKLQESVAEQARIKQLGISPMEIMRLTVATIIDEFYPTELDKVELDIEIHKKLLEAIKEAQVAPPEGGSDFAKTGQPSGLIVPGRG